MVALRFLTLLALTGAALADATHRITIPATSPLLHYTPGKTADTKVGQWNMSSTELGPPGVSRELVLNGERYAWAFGGPHGSIPRVSFTFTGSTATFWGYWGAPGQMWGGGVGIRKDGGNESSETRREDIYTDGQKMRLGGPINFDANGTHTVELSVRYSRISFSYLEVDLWFPGVDQGLVAAAAAAPNISTPIENHGTNYTLNPSFTSFGEWENTPTLGSTVYPRLVTQIDGAWLYWEIPRGNAFLRINGTVDWMSYKYTVEIDPPPPDQPGSVTLSQASDWTAIDQPLYVSRLDPQQKYTVKVTNHVNPNNRTNHKYLNIVASETWYVGFEDDGSEANVTSTITTIPSGSASPSPTNGNTNGTDAGSGPRNAATKPKNNTPLIVGCVIAALVLIILLLAIRFRKRLAALCHRENPMDDDKLEIDTDMHVDAYPASSYMTAAGAGYPTPFVSPLTPLSALSQGLSQGLSHPSLDPSSQSSESKYDSVYKPVQPAQPVQPVPEVPEVEIVTQAQDGGRARVRERVIPPSYNPAWRTSIDSEGEALDSGSVPDPAVVVRDIRLSMAPGEVRDDHVRKR